MLAERRPVGRRARAREQPSGFALSTRDEVDGTPAFEVGHAAVALRRVQVRTGDELPCGRRRTSTLAGRNGVRDQRRLDRHRQRAKAVGEQRGRVAHPRGDADGDRLLDPNPCTANVACRHFQRDARDVDPDAVLGDDDGRTEEANAVETVGSRIAHWALCAPPSASSTRPRTTGSRSSCALQLRTRALGGITPLGD